MFEDDRGEYPPMGRPLMDVEGQEVAYLWNLRSFGNVRQQISRLQRDILLIVFVVLVAGLVLTQVLARRIVDPLAELDKAASEVARQTGT